MELKAIMELSEKIAEQMLESHHSGIERRDYDYKEILKAVVRIAP